MGIMRISAYILALGLFVSACTADMVIPTEEEATAAGSSAAAAAEAFIGVFEDAAAAELDELAAQIDGTEPEPIWPTTTVDPLDLFDPINDCRWEESTTFTETTFSLVLPAFVEIAPTADGFSTFHAEYSYGDCASMVGDIQVLSFDTSIEPATVVGSQMSAYRALGDLVVVSEGPVTVPGSSAPAHMAEFRTAGDTHHIFLAAATARGEIVLITVHVPLDRWADTSVVALDFLRGLTAK